MQKKQTHIPYGFITGVIMVVIALVFYLTGLAFKPGMQYVVEIPFLVGIILNANAYSKANDTFVTFGNVFGSGFKMSMIVAIVMIVWSIIGIYALPEMKVKALEMAHESMVNKQPKMTDEQIEMGMNFTNKFWNTIVICVAIFGTLFWGALFSLVGGAVAKKNGERPMIEG